MATAVTDYKVKDLGLADWGRKEIAIAEHEMPGLMAIRRKYAAQPAARGRAHRRQAAHDHSDGRAHRDPAELWAPRSAGRAAISSPLRTTPPPPSPSRAHRFSRAKANRWRITGITRMRILHWADGGRPNLHSSTTAATPLCSSTSAAMPRRIRQDPGPQCRESERGKRSFWPRSARPCRDRRILQPGARRTSSASGRDHHRRPPAVSEGKNGDCCVSRPSTSTTR